ncbi:MAG: hypothetical protein UW70_C0030G0026, partial [Candidatus Peregrinibacteria bacterium GW2011_GWA2_44_7]
MVETNEWSDQEKVKGPIEKNPTTEVDEALQVLAQQRAERMKGVQGEAVVVRTQEAQPRVTADPWNER